MNYTSVNWTSNIFLENILLVLAIIGLKAKIGKIRKPYLHPVSLIYILPTGNCKTVRKESYAEAHYDDNLWLILEGALCEARHYLP